MAEADVERALLLRDIETLKERVNSITSELVSEKKVRREKDEEHSNDISIIKDRDSTKKDSRDNILKTVFVVLGLIVSLVTFTFGKTIYDKHDKFEERTTKQHQVITDKLNKETISLQQHITAIEGRDAVQCMHTQALIASNNNVNKNHQLPQINCGDGAGL